MRDHREQLGSQRITRTTKLIDLAAELLIELDGDDVYRNASNSSGSGRSSGRIHAPVCTTSRSVSSCHGPNNRVGRGFVLVPVAAG
jgi:hypothetical protein